MSELKENFQRDLIRIRSILTTNRSSEDQMTSRGSIDEIDEQMAERMLNRPSDITADEIAMDVLGERGGTEDSMDGVRLTCDCSMRESISS